MTSPTLAKDLALLLLLATVWGAAYSFIRVGVETIPPITLIAARTLLAGALLLAILKGRGLRLPRDMATWRRFLIQACLNSALPFTLIAWAELHVEAGLAVILNALTPIFTFLITAGITRHESLGPRKLIGVVLGISGTCLIIGFNAFHSAGTDLIAQLAVVLASVCYAMAAIFGRNFRGLDPMMPAAGSLISGAAILIPFSLVIDRPWTLSVSFASIAALLALSVFSTALAFVIYFRLVHRLGSVATTSQAYLRVPIGVGIGAVFLGERFSPTVLAGLLLVVAGVFAMSVPAPVRLSQPLDWLRARRHPAP
ncbi:DMT family transporter [Allorhizobium taibaishanense]|uniref:Drug/metabolite transporter (DMT)-like permease n=1 Tax=Allorhizobium taibaishanense TaxID=887144 RepID=A0A1Q9AAH8_9HYPH|nr:EamA family transporter [Allorhizobium taibaishanense]MBB4007072.1 drug/metabolite transporter (DMT)-like permease [Allorhizobium taibaishanense]OLP51869.1 hypothetical protein BJF91_23390 [Allorhizobium taibaishanense]